MFIQRYPVGSLVVRFYLIPGQLVKPGTFGIVCHPLDTYYVDRNVLIWWEGFRTVLQLTRMILLLLFLL